MACWRPNAASYCAIFFAPAADLLRRKLAKERAGRKKAESLLEQKSYEIYIRHHDLQTEVAKPRRIEVTLRQQGAAMESSYAELAQFPYIVCMIYRRHCGASSGFLSCSRGGSTASWVDARCPHSTASGGSVETRARQELVPVQQQWPDGRARVRSRRRFCHLRF